jgi:twitching motility protein PilT
MLRHVASSEALHVITIEDPVEYRLTDSPSCISQREVGRDTASYADALKAALREDPDLLFVGEIRDSQSLEVVLQAAETGHAVISTFHTGTALKTIQRLLAMLPGDDQSALRSRLADTLRGIISQRLLPRKGTRGRVLCCEVLLNNYSIKECIKDAAKLPTIPAVLERSGDQRMHTFDKYLAALVREGLVAPDVAISYATTPGDFKRTLNLQGTET